MLMLLLGVGGAWLRWRGELYQQRLFLRFAVAMGPAGIIAMLAGWMTTEIGRQPWVVYGVMRTADAASHHSALVLSASLLMFVLVYFAVFGTGIILLAEGGRRRTLTAARPYSTPITRGSARLGRCRGARDRSVERGRIAMGIDLSLIWVLIIAFGLMMYVVMDGCDLGIGILFPFVPATKRPGHHGQYRGPGLGRQRDLAGAGRRRAAGGVSPRLRGAVERAIYPDPADADGTDPARRGIRVPFQGRTRATGGSGISRSPAGHIWRHSARVRRWARSSMGSA